MAGDTFRLAWRFVRAQFAAALAARAELAQSIALLAGWALVTLGVARIVRPDVVWPLSAGLLLLLVCGVEWIADIFWHGLYQLTRDGLDG
jgi:hypothetical protein